MTILLVEDDLEICTMLKNYLATENFTVVTANDGREACRKFKEGNFELVLLDLMIPYISGMDVLQFIRKESVVPVIILSAKDTDWAGGGRLYFQALFRDRSAGPD